MGKLRISEKEIRQDFEKAFPNKQIKVISQDKKIYARLCSLANLWEQHPFEVLQEWGYEPIYKKGMTLEETQFYLNWSYPDKYLYDLRKNEPSIYRHLYRLAIANNHTVTTLLRSWGFTLVSGNDILQEQNYKGLLAELSRIYPDKRIYSLKTNHLHIYMRVGNYAKKEGVSVSDWLTSQGYYVLSRKQTANLVKWQQISYKKAVSDEDLIEYMNIQYPKGCPLDYHFDMKLINRLYRRASKCGVTVNKWLAIKGYEGR